MTATLDLELTATREREEEKNVCLLFNYNVKCEVGTSGPKPPTTSDKMLSLIIICARS